ncbi:MAG: hypothetical protein GY826_16070 [Fuerstiella sp.]|nr:hypothetical protein [Fuerstiella sp.]
MIVDRLRHMMQVEIQRVKRATTTAPNFLDWSDNFYGNFVSTLANALRPCIAVCQQVSEPANNWTADKLAEAHVEQSQNRLLSIAGASFPDTLADNIQRELETWTNRAAEIADELFKENQNV